MKRSTLVVAAVAVLFLAAGAAAQNDDGLKIQVGAKGGWFFWTDDPLKEHLENNWSVGGELKMWFANNFGLGGEIQWISKDADVPEDGIDINFDYTQIPINLNGYYRFPMSGDSSFYVGGGLSFVFADATLSAQVEGIRLSVSADDTAFGFNGVAGYEFGRFFVEAQWLWAEATFEFNETIEVDDTVQLGGPSFWVGVRF